MRHLQKQCAKCTEFKDPSRFNRMIRSLVGLQGYRRECTRRFDERMMCSRVSRKERLKTILSTRDAVTHRVKLPAAPDK
jgi:hypothetical protein